MSLQGFQHALADLVASPDLCRRLRDAPETVLPEYDLSGLEQRRLIAVVRHRGMSVTCTLYRASRLEALYTMLPLTCVVLGEDLKGEAECYWQFREYTDLQFQTEIACFGTFLRARLRDAKLSNVYAREVLDFELAASELRYHSRRNAVPTPDHAAAEVVSSPLRLHPLLRMVAFDHEPGVVLEALHRRDPLPPRLPVATWWVMLDARGGELAVSTVDVQLGALLGALRDADAQIADANAASALLALGLVVPAA
jgi:hypothetical protein